MHWENLAFQKGYMNMKMASGKRRKISTDICKLAKSQRMLYMKANYFISLRIHILCLFILLQFDKHIHIISIYQNGLSIFITGKNNIIIIHVLRQLQLVFSAHSYSISILNNILSRILGLKEKKRNCAKGSWNRRRT